MGYPHLKFFMEIIYFAQYFDSKNIFSPYKLSDYLDFYLFFPAKIDRAIDPTATYTVNGATAIVLVTSQATIRG